MPGPKSPDQIRIDTSAHLRKIPGFKYARSIYKNVQPQIDEAVTSELIDDPNLSRQDKQKLKRTAFRTAEQMYPLVYKDSLTGLNNKRWFNEEVEKKTAEAYRTKRPLWILTLDVDDFKRFNTLFGHDGGDEALKAISKLPFRKEEPIARIGGDEFSELLEEISEEQIISVVKRYIVHMRDISQSLDLTPITEIDDEEMARNITLTFGLTKYDRGESVEEFKRRANLAMLKAKNEGKNKIIIAEKTTDPENPTYRDLEL